MKVRGEKALVYNITTNMSKDVQEQKIDGLLQRLHRVDGGYSICPHPRQTPQCRHGCKSMDRHNVIIFKQELFSNLRVAEKGVKKRARALRGNVDGTTRLGKMLVREVSCLQATFAGMSEASAVGFTFEDTESLALSPLEDDASLSPLTVESQLGSKTVTTTVAIEAGM